MIKAWIFQWDKKSTTKQVDFVRKRFKSCHWRMSTGTAFLLEGGGWITFANLCPLDRCKLRSLRLEKPWDEPPTGLAGGFFAEVCWGAIWCGGFLKCWVSPTNPWVFLLKMIILGWFCWYHHLRKHPCEPDDIPPSFEAHPKLSQGIGPGADSSLPKEAFAISSMVPKRNSFGIRWWFQSGNHQVMGWCERTPPRAQCVTRKGDFGRWFSLEPRVPTGGSMWLSSGEYMYIHWVLPPPCNSCKGFTFWFNRDFVLPSFWDCYRLGAVPNIYIYTLYTQISTAYD